MFRRNCLLVALSALTLTLLVVVGSGSVLADSVEKKWRVGLALGGFNSLDEVESASANEMFTLNQCIRTLSCTQTAEVVIRAFRDPRNDSSVFGSLDLNSAPLGTLSVQYGINKVFVVEGSVGYQKGDVGDVEVAVELPGNGPLDPNIIPFNFVTERVRVGEIERVPIQVSALARFRPRATFNPYVGVGIGYSIVGFEIAPAFNQLSVNMDASRGVQMRLEPFFVQGSAGGEQLSDDGLPQLDLTGATIDARDTFEWHLAGGAEITFKRRWAAFVDVRWVDASRSVSVGFNNSNELGNSLPNFTPFNDDAPIADARYGPVNIGSCNKDATGMDQNGNPVSCQGGGLIDFGRVTVEPAEQASPNQQCIDPSDIASGACVLNFEFTPDGVPDPGRYYAQGGSVDYDGFSAQFGIRLTFGK